jgi:hypothetical protein
MNTLECRVVLLPEQTATSFHDYYIDVDAYHFGLGTYRRGCRSIFLATTGRPNGRYITLQHYSRLNSTRHYDHVNYQKMFKHLVVLPVMLYTGEEWHDYHFAGHEMSWRFPQKMDKAPHLVHLLLGGARMAMEAHKRSLARYFMSGSDDELAQALAGDFSLAWELYNALIPNCLACDVRWQYRDTDARLLRYYLREGADYSGQWGGTPRCGCDRGFYYGEKCDPPASCPRVYNDEDYYGHWNDVRDSIPVREVESDSRYDE